MLTLRAREIGWCFSGGTMVTVQKVQAAAASVEELSPYRFGDKVLLSRVASLLGTSVEQLKPSLLRWQRDGAIELARVDMVAGMGVPGAVKRSMIRAHGMPETSGWHAVVAALVEKRRKGFEPRLRVKSAGITRASRGARKMRARERKRRDDLVAQAKVVIGALKAANRELGAVLKPWAIEEGRLLRKRERLPADLDLDLSTIDEAAIRTGVDELIGERIQHLEELIENWK